MNVSLIDVDGHNFPNLALMKLSAWHKAQGDVVDWYCYMLSNPDRIYASKVFTFSPDGEIAAWHPWPICGGTGYNPSVKLPEEIEIIAPDYSIYPQFKGAYGFLTRGCVRNCPWCIVPRKEGGIKVVSDIETIAQGRREVVLMDNNFLAAPAEFVSEQLEKASRLNLKLDSNQGLDARLVTPENAKFLASVKWMKYIRFSCDTQEMIQHVGIAVQLLRLCGYRGDFFIYVLAREVQETHDRISRLSIIDRRIIPFCQPYRDFTTNEDPPVELRRLARWCNVQSIRKSIKFKDYKV